MQVGGGQGLLAKSGQAPLSCTAEIGDPALHGGGLAMEPVEQGSNGDVCSCHVCHERVEAGIGAGVTALFEQGLLGCPADAPDGVAERGGQAEGTLLGCALELEACNEGLGGILVDFQCDASMPVIGRGQDLRGVSGMGQGGA